MFPRTQCLIRCRWLSAATLTGIVVLLTLAPAWGGAIRGGHAKGKPAAEGSDQDSPVSDLVSDAKPLTGKGKAKGLADEASLPPLPRSGTGWSARDPETSLAAAPERVSALDVGGKLVAVLLCVYGLFTGVRLFKTGHLAWPRLPRSDVPAAELRLVEALALGGNRRVYLIQAGGRTLLIGADASGLAALGEVPTPSASRPSLPSPLEGATSPDDTNEIMPALAHRSETRATVIGPVRAPEERSRPRATLSGAQQARDESDWARKRDILIRALKEKATG